MIGFVETKRGCCGTGFVEAGPLCNALAPVCGNVLEYLFWDSIHPGQAAYQHLSKYLEKKVIPELLNDGNQSHNLFDQTGQDDSDED